MLKDNETEELEEEFLQEEASLSGKIIVGVIVLVILAVLVWIVWFAFSRKDGGADEEVPDMGVVTEATPEPTATPAPTATPVRKEENTVENENPAGMGQEAEGVIPEETTPNVEEGHVFREVEETITAKNATNLRNMPSQGSESKVVVTLKNGQTATRIGISDTGWSKVEYKGEVYYAVSGYLTTDLSTPTPAPTPVPVDDGIKTVFTPCEEMVSPKMEVNLRKLPSVTNPEATVVVKLPYGAVVKRTGINTDVGWSRVEYEGQTLYCVSSYVFVVE